MHMGLVQPNNQDYMQALYKNMAIKEILTVHPSKVTHNKHLAQGEGRSCIWLVL